MNLPDGAHMVDQFFAGRVEVNVYQAKVPPDHLPPVPASAWYVQIKGLPDAVYAFACEPSDPDTVRGFVEAMILANNDPPSWVVVHTDFKPLLPGISQELRGIMQQVKVTARSVRFHAKGTESGSERGLLSDADSLDYCVQQLNAIAEDFAHDERGHRKLQPV